MVFAVKENEVKILPALFINCGTQSNTLNLTKSLFSYL